MARRESINVSLTPEQAELLASCVRSGRYQSTSEAVREGVRLLDHEHRRRQAEIERARKMIAAGADDLRQGRIIEGDDFFAGWDAELDELETARASRPPASSSPRVPEKTVGASRPAPSIGSAPDRPAVRGAIPSVRRSLRPTAP